MAGSDREPETAGRDHAGRFRPGRSGNPSGRPPGARHAALAALDAVGAEGAEAVLRAVVEAARGGDLRAAEILLRRLWPEPRGRPVALPLPALRTAAEVPAALAAVAGAMARGELTPAAAAAAAAVVEAQRRAADLAGLEARVAALEGRAGGAGP